MKQSILDAIEAREDRFIAVRDLQVQQIFHPGRFEDELAIALAELKELESDIENRTCFDGVCSTDWHPIKDESTTLPKRWPGQAAISWAKWHQDAKSQLIGR